MPPSVAHNYNPPPNQKHSQQSTSTSTMHLEKTRRPLRARHDKSNSTSSLTSNLSIPPCDKSTTTCSTEDLSYISLSNSSFSKHTHGSHYSLSTTTTAAASEKKPLDAPVPIHAQSSLLDMTMDESHDEETSTSHNRSFTSPRKSRSNNSSFETSFDLGMSSSIMETTEKNLAAISESMTGSFCHNPSFQNEEENTSNLNLNCNLGGMPDCSSYEYRNDANTNTKSYKSLFSDTIVQNRLLDDFKYLLGNNVMPCCEEKTILAGCLGLSNVDDRVEIETPRIRNRAGESWRARAYRIRRLREEKMLMIRSTVTHPSHSNQHQPQDIYGYGASMGFRRQLSMERAIGKSHSADLEMPSRTGYGMKSRRRKAFRAREDPSDALGRIIGDCIDPIAPKEEAVELEVVWKQEDLCYDSDPGEMPFRSLQKETTGSSASADMEKPGMTRSKSLEDQLKEKGAGGKRRSPHYYSSFDKKKDHFLGENGSFDVHVSFEDSSQSDDSQYSDDDDDSVDDSTCYSGSSMGRQWYSNSHNTPTLKQVRKKALREDNGVAQHVQKALNQTWTLTWHPVKSKPNAKSKINTNSNEPKAQSPRCIRLWFERGNRIRGNNIVEPKLMWRDAYNPQLSAYRKLNDSITKKGPNQICLLSICRILEVDHYCLDRQKYPFAKKSCSFLIRTCEDEEFLFEAQSEKEREDIVYLWKLVVARLASQAVVGDGDKMVGEFFVPSSLGVP